jgi:hypothetical protein
MRSASKIVGIGDKTTAMRAQTERAEIIAGNKFPHVRSGARIIAITTNDDWTVGITRLHRSQLFKFGCVFLQVFPGSRGEKRVVAVIAGSSVDAAIRVIANADERFGVGDWQIFH